MKIGRLNVCISVYFVSPIEVKIIQKYVNNISVNMYRWSFYIACKILYEITIHFDIKWRGLFQVSLRETTPYSSKAFVDRLLNGNVSHFECLINEYIMLLFHKSSSPPVFPFSSYTGNILTDRNRNILITPEQTKAGSKLSR